MWENEDYRYLHGKYAVIEEHTAVSRWETCMCRSCQDKRERLTVKIDIPES